MVSRKQTPIARFTSWLNAALDQAGVVQGRGRAAAVGKRYGVSAQGAGKWLRGDSMPESKQLLRIVMDLEPGAAADELEAYRHVARHSIADQPAVYVSTQATPPGYLRLPLLAMEGSMGSGGHNDGPVEVVTDLDVADWWANAHFPKPLTRIKVMTGRGDSNAGLINDGDVVFVDTYIDHFAGEGLYVFNWQGRALIKRLTPDLRSNRLKIVSANPAYQTEFIEVGELDQLQIAGRVVAWWTLRTH